jgi:hypothetical protein
MVSHRISALAPGIASICVDCADPRGLAAWWQQLLGGEVYVDNDGDVALHAEGADLMFLAVPEAKNGKNRLHLDLRATDFESAVAAAIELGAQPADDVYQGLRWQVLRDPEGNEFCILRPSDAPEFP